ncbi:MAG: STAS domain-containing protein [Candidatus Krumholzibacteria bacterium]|jgi:anti-sigma B factor antagonist|nr:STAS domain-containing protein [Candidatus Krumholzibacteria bacterium]MDP6797455.1 STAS domain-containing protein [Candidatus Krumholzibacteria bacterium]MDP7020982.1 STAS domain-containing protein [Candidatus Krumholzibacteria bacterium]
MKITKSQQGGSTLLQIQGEIEVFTLPELRESAEDCLGGAEEIIFHLGELEYIDSAGLGYLVDLNERFRARGQRLLLVELTEHVSKILRITHLDRILEIQSSLEYSHPA